VFEKQRDVVDFLCSRFKRKNGRPVAERTVYGHLQGRGKKGKLLYPQPSGGYSLEDVRDYAGRQGYVPMEKDGLAEERKQSEQQIDLEIQEKERKLEKLTLECQARQIEISEKQKKFVLRDDLEAELVARAVALRHFLHQQFSERRRELAEKDEDALVDTAMDCVDQAMHEYVSTDGFHILVVD
jgi:hypothetical protein